MFTQQKNIFSDKKTSKQRAFSWSLWIFVVLTLLITILPFIVKQLSTHYFIEQQQADLAEIDNVDINLFAGKLVFENIEVQKEDFDKLRIEKLSINIDWLPLLSQQLLVRSFLIRNANLQVDVSKTDAISVNGLTFPTTSTDGSSNEKNTADTQWQFGVEQAHIADSHLKIIQPQHDSDLAIQAVTISHLISWLPNRPTVFKTKFNLDNAPVVLEGTSKPFETTLPLTAHFTAENFNLAKLKPLLNNENITTLKGTLKTDLNIRGLFSTESEYDIKLEGFIKTNGFQGMFADNIIEQNEMSWEGLTQLQYNIHNANFSLFNKGTTELQQLNYASEHSGLSLTTASITSEGQFSYESNPSNFTKNPSDTEEKNTASPFHFIGRVAATDLHATQRKNEITLASLQSIEMPNIELGGIGHIEIPVLNIQQAKLLGAKTTTNGTAATNADSAPEPEAEATPTPEENSVEYLLKIRETVINNIQLNPDVELNIADIMLADTNGEIIRQADGKLKYIDDIISSFTAPTDNKAQQTPALEEPASMPPAHDSDIDNALDSAAITEGKIPEFIFRIGAIEVGGDSQLSFKDDATKPDFYTKLSKLKLKIVGLNSQDKTQNSQIDLTATVDETSEINLSGFVQPFSKPINAQVFGKVASLELPPLSSYTASTLGYHLKRGRVSADLSLNIINGNIESKNDIVISKLNLEEKDEEDIKKLTEELAMPLDKALDLLRDSKGNINITLPVTGNVNDPNFDFTPIMNQALGKAIRSATLSYVEHALQPWSTLITVAKIAGKQVNKIKFEPLLFKVGSDKIVKDNYDYLNKISKMLQDRPDIEISLCGVSSLQDKLALSRTANNDKGNQVTSKSGQSSSKNTTPRISKKALLKLAKRRSHKVINYLVKKRNIDTKRLYTCKPTYLNRKSAMPSVEIVL